MKYRALPDQASARLEESLLEARQRPALDGDRQDQPTQEVAEVVRDNAQEQPHLIRSEAVTGEPRPVGGFLAFLDPLLRRAPLVVEADDGAIRSVEGGDNEAYPREQLAEVMLGGSGSRRKRGRQLRRACSTRTPGWQCKECPFRSKCWAWG